MGGGADTGSGLVGLAKKFALTGTSSMMAEVRVQRRRDEILWLLNRRNFAKWPVLVNYRGPVTA